MPPPTNNWRQLLAEATRLLALGQLARAEPLFRAVLSVRPRECDALQGLGAICADTARAPEAVDLLQQALALKPTLAEAHATLAFALARLDRRAEADAALQKALALKPDEPAFHCNYGALLVSLNKLDGAIASFQRAIALAPANAEAHFNLANAQRDIGRTEEAIASYRRALELRPNYGGALHNLASLLHHSSRFDEALHEYRRALAISPPFTSSLGGIAGVLHGLGRTEEAVATFREHLRFHPGDPVPHSNMLYSMECIPGQSSQSMRAAYALWGKTHGAPPDRLTAHANDRSPDRRLRIGYCSPDLRSHSVSYFIEPLLAHHDPAQVEVFCYSDVPTPDATTRRLQALAHQWRQTAGLDHAGFARTVHEDQIDILVDLAGHTSGNRLLAFARKPAPVQVTYLGYPAITGLDAIDYRLTDHFADPEPSPGTADECSTEKLVRLPETFLCYRPPDDAQPVRLDRDPAQPVTFCSFNALPKINPQLLALWARVLRAIPNSRLLLKSTGLAASSAKQSLIDAFTREGITADRLDLRAYTDSHAAHFALYNQADIALDTFPYHGTTTTCEALWMGLPVITLAGERHAGRVGVSILSNLALPEFIAHSPEEYIQIATTLAADPRKRMLLRASMRDRMNASPLRQPSRFARHVENAYRDMWRTWCAETPTTPTTTQD